MITPLDRFKSEVCNYLGLTDPFTVKAIETIGGFAFSDIMDTIMSIHPPHIGIREGKVVKKGKGIFASNYDYVLVGILRYNLNDSILSCEVTIKIKGFNLLARFVSEDGNIIKHNKIEITPSDIKKIIKKHEKNIQSIQNKICVYNDLLSGV